MAGGHQGLGHGQGHLGVIGEQGRLRQLLDAIRAVAFPNPLEFPEFHRRPQGVPQGQTVHHAQDFFHASPLGQFVFKKTTILFAKNFF